MDGIDALAFDLYGTLLEVASVGRAAAEITADPAALVDLWRTKQLEYTWLRTLMGRYQDFWATTGDALDFALDRLGSSHRLAVLSNGNPDMLEAGLAAAGLRERFGHVLSVDELGMFKPHPSVYELATKAFGLPAERILFVSSNGWDAFGARSFGLPVAWVNRAGAPLERLGTPPNLVVPDLTALAEAVG